MNANAVNGTHFPEQEMVRHFHGTCLAVSAMHDYRASGSKSTQAAKPPSQKSTANRPASPEGNDDDDDDDDDRDQERLLPHPEEDIEGEGFSYGNAPSVPRAMQKRQQQTGEVVFDGDQELSVLERVAESSTDPNNSIPVPYAHRDIKPACVCLSFRPISQLMTMCFTVT